MANLIPLLENQILTKDEFNKIKYYVTKEYLTDKEKEDLVSQSDYCLIRNFFASNDGSSREELIKRNIDVDKKNLLGFLNNIELIDLYRETKDVVIKETLLERGLSDFI